MNKRFLKISAFLLAVVLILGLAWFANGLVGNPVSKMLATNTAKKHLEAHYADKDFVLDGVVFSFKIGCYHAYISSPSSPDSSFTLVIGLDGKLLTDYYEDHVLSGWNTSRRLDDAYRSAVDAMLHSPSFPYTLDFGYGSIYFIESEYQHNPSVPDYAIVTSDLRLDGFYDVNALGAEAGELTLYLYDDTVSAEHLAEMLLGIRSVFDDAGVKFRVISCVLEYPPAADGTREDHRVEVLNFPYDDISAEGLVDRVTAADAAAKAYYAAQDAEKQEFRVEFAP